MKSTVETLSPTRVKLAIEVPFDELKPSLQKAYREIGAQVQVPGFRRGKIPAAVIDQRVGRGAVLNEAVQEAIPQQILAAVREHDVKTLGRPEVEITEFGDNEPLKFTAEVDGLTVHGIDMIRWDAAGKLAEFTVMVRPLSAAQALAEAMNAQFPQIQREAAEG